MNIVKILSDLMKRRESLDPGKYLYAETGGYVYYSPDAVVMYRIPEDRFYLDVGKVFKDIAPFNVKSIWRPDEATLGELTGNLRILLNEKGKGNRTVVQIRNGSTVVWVNKKLLENFDRDCSFRITSRKDPVYVYENGEPVGFLLPVRMNDEDYV